MRKRLLAIILGIIIVFLLGGILVLWRSPRVLGFSPADEAAGVAASAPLKITFSAAMSAATVRSRLHVEPSLPGQIAWQGHTLVFTPDHPWPNGKTITVSLKAGAESAGWPYLAIPQETRWTFTVEQALLAYLYPSDGFAGLYALDPESGQSQQIGNTPGEVLDFSLSPNGAAIYYSANVEGQGSSLYRLDRASGQATLVLDCPHAQCRYVQVSPQGDYLAYERTELQTGGQVQTPHVWLLALQAGQVDGAPLPAAEASQQTQQPAWSPGGLLTYYNATQAVFVVQDPKQGVVTRFPSQTGQPGAWDPQGQTYIFPEITIKDLGNTDLSPLPTSHLMRYTLTGDAPGDLTQLDTLEDTDPAFAPDGQTLAFARKYLDLQHWTPGRQLWTMQPDGSHAKAWTNDPTDNFYDFAWNAAGNRLAFVRFNQTTLSDPPAIWVMDMNNGVAHRLLVRGYAPQWMP